MGPQDYRIYQRNECAVFLRTAEQFGGLSNMAGGYPLSINGIRIPTSEALYQACRFPHLPDVQQLIIGQTSPMAAKMKSKPYRKDSRLDWDAARINIMRWCLRVKLVQNWEKFGELLLSTGNKPIVEESYRDPFWGAKPINSETLSGVNILGRLLVQLREKLRDPEASRLWIVEPPPLPQFLLLGRQISLIEIAKPKTISICEAREQALGNMKPSISDRIVISKAEVNTYTESGETDSHVPAIEMPLGNFRPGTTVIQHELFEMG